MKLTKESVAHRQHPVVVPLCVYQCTYIVNLLLHFNRIPTHASYQAALHNLDMLNHIPTCDDYFKLAETQLLLLHPFQINRAILEGSTLVTYDFRILATST